MKKALKILLLTILLAFLSVLVLRVPILGGLWGVITMLPLTSVFPEFGRTGVHVEYGFLWLVIKTNFAWIVLFSYYFVFWSLILLLVHFIRNLMGKNKDNLKPLK